MNQKNEFKSTFSSLATYSYSLSSYDRSQDYKQPSSDFPMDLSNT
jgi:hypothetical protein